MAFLGTNVYDQGLNYLDTNGDTLHICSAEPDTYAEASATFALGIKTALNIGAPAAGSPDGRQVTVPAVTDGTVTATGTATHWAITDGASELLAAGALSASQAVTNGNPFTLTSFTIRIPAPA